MEKCIKADLMEGIDSCMRILVTLRGKNIKPTSINMENDKMVLYIDEAHAHNAFLNLSKLEDVQVSVE